MNSVVMSFDNMLANGQAKSAASRFPASCQVSSVKTFKNSSQVIFPNSKTVIAYLDQYPLPIYFVSACFHFPILFSIFDGVINKVNENLSYFFLVGKYAKW